MVNLLLDTHTLLWAVIYPRKLSVKAKYEIYGKDNIIWVSVVTFWEISVKYSLNKLRLQGTAPEELPDCAEKAGFRVLNISAELTSSFYKLPRLNKDPFDRMLAWQAIKENFTLLSKDKGFDVYQSAGLVRLW